MRSVDEERYAGYVRLRLPALRRLAWLLCGDAHRADDVVQVAITRLYTHWHRAQAAHDLDRYVRAIVVRTFLNERRGFWARVRLVGAAERVPLPAAPAGPDVETRDLVHAALRRVPPRQRAVLVLRFLEDRSVDEVAAALRCSTGTVKSQTAHGLAALRRLLDTPRPAAAGNGA